MLKYIIIYLSAMSLLTFILFGADKHKARAHKWRIPENAPWSEPAWRLYRRISGHGIFPSQNKTLVFLYGDDNFSCTMGIYHIQGHCRVE